MLRCPPDQSPQRRIVADGELSIGRAPDNDWVLADPDRVLSKRHCVLAFRRGAWHVADMSSNGTYFNGDAEPIGMGRVRTLQDGDRIRLGPYELGLRVAAAPAERVQMAAGSANPFDEPGGRPAVATPVRPAASVAPVSEPSEATFIVQGSEPLPPPALPHASPAPLPAATADLFAAFLRGAGLPPTPPADAEAAMEQLGAAFRAAVIGIRHTLMARAAVKDEFRIEQTLIRARGNNPLKFAASDLEALATLAGLGRRTEMPAAAAMADALRDIHLHELATMSAMQTAVRGLLKQLDPQPLREEGERSGGMLPAQRRARAFELYEKLYADIGHALSDDFDRVFGSSFARAYAQALEAAAEREPR